MKKLWWLFPSVVILLVFSVIVPKQAQAQGPTPTPTLQPGSTQQLYTDIEPFSNVRLYPEYGRDTVSFPTSGGGNLFLDAGSPCVKGYTTSGSAYAIYETYANGSGPVEFSYTSDNPEANVAMYMWDSQSQQFFCDPSFNKGSAVVDESNLKPGIYYFWILTDKSVDSYSNSGQVLIRVWSSLPGAATPTK